jgi:uncharacterized protein (TIGR03084 family)
MTMDGDSVLVALAAQREELDGFLTTMDREGWDVPTPRCPGWSVIDVVLHLAQTDELAIASAEGRFMGFRDDAPQNVDAAAAVAVASQRGQSGEAVLDRWRRGAADQLRTLSACDPSQRLQWVAGELSARTLATTRLSECWIHTGDIASALGVAMPPTDRLWHIARLAWRTLPYAYGREDRTLAGPVALALTAPDGTTWDFHDDAAASTTIVGPAEDFCLVAGRRLLPSESSLVASGSDADTVLELVRTFA